MKAKNIITTLLLSISALSLSAQGNQKPIPEGFLPEVGDFAIGISFSPVSAFKTTNNFGIGNAMGSTIVSINEAESQMFFLAQDPVAAFNIKYKSSAHFSFVGSIGFGGASLHYREYVLDDMQYFLDPMSNQQVVDHITYDQTSGCVQLGFEYNAGMRKLQFITGLNLVYAFGGGTTNFSYGNAITELNQLPSTTALIDNKTDYILNQWQSDGDIIYARPTQRYNVGFEHGIGIKASMGVEWFMISHLSLSAKATFTPIMVAFQPQTYTTYEGWSTVRNQLITDYNVLVSPGSWYLLYGTDKIGLDISLHYYF